MHARALCYLATYMCMHMYTHTCKYAHQMYTHTYEVFNISFNTLNAIIGRLQSILYVYMYNVRVQCRFLIQCVHTHMDYWGVSGWLGHLSVQFLPP